MIVSGKSKGAMLELAENNRKRCTFSHLLLGFNRILSHFTRNVMSTAAATAANAARFQHRRQGQYLPRHDNLSLQQQTLLAAVPHWKQELVHTTASKRKATGDAEPRGVKIRKWVIDTGAEKAGGNRDEMDAAIKKVVQDDVEAAEAAKALIGGTASSKGGRSGTATPSAGAGDMTPIGTLDSTPIVSPALTPLPKPQHPLANSFSVADLSAPQSSPAS